MAIALSCTCGSVAGPRRGFSELWATSVTILWAISRATVRIVPSAGSRTEEYARSAAFASAAPISVASISWPGLRHQLLRRTADQLGEDHAGVAPGAQQRRARDRLHDLLAPDLVDGALAVGALQAVELIEDGPQRERHVVAGVAVGDREHVEVVDLLATRFQMRERPCHGDAKAQEIGVRHDDTSISYGQRTLRRPALDAVGEAAQSAFVTLPAFRQRVHTYTRRGALPTRILTFCRFGSKRRLVATIEWLRLLPNAGPLPQLWHTLAMVEPSVDDLC